MLTGPLSPIRRLLPGHLGDDGRPVAQPLRSVVVGVGLLYWGYQKSEGFESQLTSTITGAQPDEVMLMYIAGAVCVAIGGFLNLKS